MKRWRRSKKKKTIKSQHRVCQILFDFCKKSFRKCDLQTTLKLHGVARETHFDTRVDLFLTSAFM